MSQKHKCKDLPFLTGSLPQTGSVESQGSKHLEREFGEGLSFGIHLRHGKHVCLLIFCPPVHTNLSIPELLTCVNINLA